MTMTTPTTDQLLAAARELAPELEARAEETERLGTMPADLVERVRTAGLFRVAQPLGLGGLEAPPHTLIEVVEELCRADASSGWTTLIGIGGNAFAGWLEPTVARELLGADADVTVATVFAPTGLARPHGPGTMEVGGRWPFASGCRHAEWFLTGVMMMHGDAPRIIPGHGPDWRLAYLPRDRASIVDDWDVMGLRGTGSHDIVAEGVVVAEEHIINQFVEPARHDGALWRLPFFTLAGLAMAGFPLGVGRRALDEIAAIAPTKARAGSFEPLAADAAVQVELARAEGALRAARAYVFDAAGSLWDTACLGDVPSVAQRAELQNAAQAAMHAAIAAVDTSFHLAGAGALQMSHPLQRCFRDLHAAAQHAYFSPSALKRYTKVRFDIDQPLFML